MPPRHRLHPGSVGEQCRHTLNGIRISEHTKPGGHAIDAERDLIGRRDAARRSKTMRGQRLRDRHEVRVEPPVVPVVGEYHDLERASRPRAVARLQFSKLRVEMIEIRRYRSPGILQCVGAHIVQVHRAPPPRRQNVFDIGVDLASGDWPRDQVRAEMVELGIEGVIHALFVFDGADGGERIAEHGIVARAVCDAAGYTREPRRSPAPPPSA